MKYTVVLQRSDEGYTITCPSLPGCISEGDTEQEALDNIQDAIQGYLSVLREQTGRTVDHEVDVTVREIEVPV